MRRRCNGHERRVGQTVMSDTRRRLGGVSPRGLIRSEAVRNASAARARPRHLKIPRRKPLVRVSALRCAASVRPSVRPGDGCTRRSGAPQRTHERRQRTCRGATDMSESLEWSTGTPRDTEDYREPLCEVCPCAGTGSRRVGTRTRGLIRYRIKSERRMRRGQPAPPARLYSTKISPAEQIFDGALGTLAGH